MPELPEVEVVRRDLEREVVGKKINGVDVDGMRSIRRYRQRKQFTSELDGRKARWQSQRNLLNSAADATDFVTEIDDDGGARLRFGDDYRGYMARTNRFLPTVRAPRSR